MAQSNGLDDAKIILIATQHASESDFAQLQLLAAEHKHVLPPVFLYRLLLTYLPADVEDVSSLVTFLGHIEHRFSDVNRTEEALSQSAIQDTPVHDSRRRLHELRLEGGSELDECGHDDDLGRFLVQWIRKLEDTAGISALTLQLLEPFLINRPRLSLWQNTILTPLLKLQNDFYPSRADSLNIQILERLHGIFGIKTLLQFAEDDGDKARIGRDLGEVVTPWVQGASKLKRRRIDSTSSPDSDTTWHDVNEWILSASQTNFDLAAKSILDWDGPSSGTGEYESFNAPHDANAILSYVQTGIALITTSTDTGEDVNKVLTKLLERLASLSASAVAATTRSTGQRRALSDASRADMLRNSMLNADNPITYPSEETLKFLGTCLSAQRVLNGIKLSLPVVAIIDTALFSSEERQKQELIRILEQIPRLTRSDISWTSVRQHIQTLCSSKDAPQNTDSAPIAYTFLGRVPVVHLETEFLDSLVAHGQYATVNDTYLDTANPPLERQVVLDHIVSAIYAAYDNASNGNRTRGGMKRASEILKTFQTKFPSASVLDHIEHLIRATHSLSFYHLTLQHGVPLQPATIRIHHDPISLIEKVLAQNHKAFTKLDDLIEIGRNLVKANLQSNADSTDASRSLEEQTFDAQHRITYLAITAALNDHDFGTAYSYITTRLATSPSQTSGSPFTDDTSWRAAYAAGKYRPSSSPKTLHDRIIGLSKRMDLLSLALTLTPTPESLSEILATWRRCEEEMDSLKVQAVQEERTSDGQAQQLSPLPGGFTEDRDLDAVETRRIMERRALSKSGPSYEEDAPMGLFDVARGAASAFKKSASPLRSGSGQISIKDDIGRDTESPRESLDEGRPSSEQQRVRKRDMVSNMVTGRLVSGMSWVLGAPPKQDDEK